MICGASLFSYFHKKEVCVMFLFQLSQEKITILNVNENRLDESLKKQITSHINMRHNPITVVFLFHFYSGSSSSNFISCFCFVFYFLSPYIHLESSCIREVITSAISWVSGSLLQFFCLFYSIIFLLQILDLPLAFHVIFFSLWHFFDLSLLKIGFLPESYSLFSGGDLFSLDQQFCNFGVGR